MSLWWPLYELLYGYSVISLCYPLLVYLPARDRICAAAVIPDKKMTSLWDTFCINGLFVHYDDVIMSAIASQITSLTIVYSTVYSAADQGKHESSASLAFVRGIHQRLVNSPHKWPVTRKMFPFDDVIMKGNPTATAWILWSERFSYVGMWCFNVVSHNKLLNKHSCCRLFEGPWRPYDVIVMFFSGKSDTVCNGEIQH